MKNSAWSNQLNHALNHYRQSFFLVEFLGLEISYTKDFCTSVFPITGFCIGPDGRYQNGLLTTVMDITMAHLSKKILGNVGVTIELTSKYFNPLVKGPGKCEARFLALNPVNRFLMATIWDVDRETIACSTATWSS